MRDSLTRDIATQALRLARQSAAAQVILPMPPFIQVASAVGGSSGGGALALSDVIIDGGTPSTTFGEAADNFVLDGGGP